ncbi:Site-specific recombinase XerD [Hyphomicrobiales bacterium]|nr:Site-specific recombinase XerD [Hyphomicrobiales bacterium]CAH1667927.1 Site-specific recombinase XerD [Hyphomicrobiales bacterium]
MKIAFPYVYKDTDRHKNNRYYYWRGKGHPKIRIRAAPGTSEFAAACEEAAVAYAAAADQTQPATKRTKAPIADTYKWLCMQYFTSAEYAQLDARTRRVRRQILEKTWDEQISSKDDMRFGDVPLGKFSAKAVGVLRDRKAGFPEAANGRVKAIRQVFKWAGKPENDYVRGNPARDIEYLRSKGDGFHTWSIDEVRTFATRHPIGTKAHLALGLLLFTGVRRSDVVKLGRQMIRSDGWLYFTESKGVGLKPKVRQLPLLPVMKQIIEKSALGNLTFLVTEFDKPFTANGFGNWFRKRCDEAGLAHCSAHGLRKAGATIAANNGATEHQLMAIFGWESPKQAALYTRKANRRQLAGAAMHFIDLGDLAGVDDVEGGDEG